MGTENKAVVTGSSSRRRSGLTARDYGHALLVGLVAALAAALASNLIFGGSSSGVVGGVAGAVAATTLSARARKNPKS